MAVTSNTGTLTPLVGGEITVATIGGGPFDLVTAYVQGGDSADELGQNLYKLYALVGTTEVLLAENLVRGCHQATILQWQTLGNGASDSQFVQAGGTSYSITVTALPTSPLLRNPVTATLAGSDEFDAAANTNISPTLPVGPFAETSSANIPGFAQLMDVSVNQTGLPQSTTITLYANNGIGSVEAAVISVTLPGPDSVTVVLRKVVLPVASIYRVGVRNNTGGTLIVPIAISTYSTSLTAGSVVTLSGDVIGPSDSNTVIKWEGIPLDAVTMGAPVTGDVPIFNGTDWEAEPLSAGAITPGPQITTLRSVVPTTPTTVVWASTGYIDFVADCGADPTGAVDCAAALDTAYTLLSTINAGDTTVPETSVKLFFPPGKYTLMSTPGISTWNFLNKTSTLIIEGAGEDNSIFQYNGFDFPTITNSFRVFLRDITFLGLGDGTIADCNGALPIGAQHEIVVERCHWYNLSATSYCLLLENAFIITIRDCEFVDCASRTTLQGIVNIFEPTQFYMDGTVFSDVGNMNGATRTLKSADNNLQLFITGAPSPDNGLIDIHNSFFDESTSCNIYINGSAVAGSQIPQVQINNCLFNPAVLDNKIACIHIANADRVDIRGVIDTGFTTGTNAPVIDLVNVHHAICQKLRVNIASLSLNLNADSACGLLEVEDAPNVVINSSAAVTELPNQVFQGTAANGGGAFITTIAISANYAARLNAEVFLSSANGVPNLTNAGRLVAKCVVENAAGGGAAFVTANAGSVNPVNSNTAAFAATDPQVSDSGFQGAGPPTAIWSVAAGNAVLTVTNPGSVSATVAVEIDEVLYGLPS